MTTRRNLFIAVYLAVQILLPLRAIVHDKFDTRGNFSWNMYATRYGCKVDYEMVDLRGRRTTIPYAETLSRPKSSIKVVHRDHLPRYHAWLCDEMRAYTDDFAGIQAKADCQLNAGPRVDLIRRGVDICSTPGYGVIQ